MDSVIVDSPPGPIHHRRDQGAALREIGHGLVAAGIGGKLGRAHSVQAACVVCQSQGRVRSEERGDEGAAASPGIADQQAAERKRRAVISICTSGTQAPDVEAAETGAKAATEQFGSRGWNVASSVEHARPFTSNKDTESAFRRVVP